MEEFSIVIGGLSIGFIPLLLFFLALLFGLWQVLFHYLYFLKLVKFKSQEPIKGFEPSVSVIICAKNEKENLKNNLESILTQDYPNFEVIVVNDASWDGTEEILSYYAEKFQNLKIVEINEGIKKMEGKKFPLTLGIKAAKNEIILLSDADCKSTSNEWISWMVAPYKNPEIEIVLGYSPYENKFSLLNLFIRAETSLTAMMYVSLALSGNPYMGVGRNLSYRRDLFFKHKGFASHHHIPSGDDDLFVRDAATETNTAVVISPKSRMISLPKNKVKQWIEQKRRHLFVGKFYNAPIKRKLGSFATSHFLFWSAAIALFFFTPSIWLPIGIIVGRWLIQWPVIYLASKKLGYRMLALFMPLMDIAYLFYSIFGAMVYTFSKKPKW